MFLFKAKTIPLIVLDGRSRDKAYLYQLVYSQYIAYAYSMNRFLRGFTLVELVIVIAVLGILVTIGMLSWNGALTGSRDHARELDARAWASSFDTYKSRYIVYPSMPTADGTAAAATICLGDFTTETNSKCGQYNSSTATAFLPASSATAMLAEIVKVGNVPTNSGPVVKNVLTGPIYYATQATVSGTVTVTAKFINFFENSCPTGFTNINSSLPSTIAQVMTGLPTGTNANACALTKTFSYTP